MLQYIKQGKIFIYPTDTIYGIGCDANNEKAVKRLRKIKQSKQPFSIIAPSKAWIRNNTHCPEKYLKLLPGPYTFIVKLKTNILKEARANSPYIGVRIPKHPFTKNIKTPFITTSANIHKTKPITEISQIPKELLNQVDIIINVGKLNNKPSTIYDLTQKQPKKIR